MKQNRAEYRKAYHKKLREQGLCIRCLKAALPNKSRCDICITKDQILDKKAKARYKEQDVMDDDKGEYIMTEQEREEHDKRWEMFFKANPNPPTEYIYKVRNMYDGYSSK